MKTRNRPVLDSLSSRIAFTGLLGALALVLGALENMLPPIPLLPPGAKLGLSNIASMYASQSLGLLPALCIALAKGVFSGITRGITAMLMSLAGGLSSTFVTWLFLRKETPFFGYCGIGVLGALTHNTAQLAVAYVLTSSAVVVYIPWLMLFAVLSGILTGLVLKVILPLLNTISLPRHGKTL